ncbi:MAG: rRNA pseudouridine synthase [Firmicutes bacterium]|nr:rRNA pseudouridine synthase [Bacillota bacterium]
MRLQTYIAHSGRCSRRKAEALIASGHVTVNGQRVTQMGIEVDEHTLVAVDGQPIQLAPTQTFALNKPRGVITTLSDPKGRPCVGDIIAEIGLPLYPVGRLDRESCGLLLLTNDGLLASRLMHPRYQIPRLYRVAVEGKLRDAELIPLRKGVRQQEEPFEPMKVHLLEYRPIAQHSILEVTVHEGHNREIRRAFESIGAKVVFLERQAVGPIRLERLHLPRGAWRPLTERQVNALRAACRLKTPSK